MATSTEKRQKVGLFQRFFHRSMSIFPRFPTFPAFSNFYGTKTPLVNFFKKKLLATGWRDGRWRFLFRWRGKLGAVVSGWGGQGWLSASRRQTRYPMWQTPGTN
jgi:hypothetical protein